MNIKLKLFPSVILEAVKAETHIKGQIDRAIDDKAARVAYQEEAGDEQFHERKLMRGIYTSLDNLKGELAQYLADKGATIGNNLVAEIDTTADTITLSLEVSNSFNKSYTDSLARLCAKYIEDATLVLWWGTFNANQAQYYTSLLASDTIAIGKCFIKVAPKRVALPYTSQITLTGTEIEATANEEFTVSYTLDDGAVDDIEIFTPRHVIWRRGVEDGIFYLTALHEGIFNCKLYSLHDESVYKNLKLLVSKE